MQTRIFSSLAYDNAMDFGGCFGEHIIPDQIHIPTASFLVSKLKRDFGGCAGNIAYNLKLLGGEAARSTCSASMR